MNGFYARRSIVVTGGAGFIGSSLVENLVRTRGVSLSDIRVPRSADFDLRRFDDAQRALDGAEIVFHLAARPAESPTAAAIQRVNTSAAP